MNQLDEPTLSHGQATKKSTDRTRYVNTTDEQEGLGLFAYTKEDLYEHTDMQPLESIDTHNRLDKMR